MVIEPRSATLGGLNLIMAEMTRQHLFFLVF
jgi:hypothetical protein